MASSARNSRRRWVTSLALGSVLTLLPFIGDHDVAKMLLTAPGMVVVAIAYIGFNLREPLSPAVNAIVTGGYFGGSMLGWALVFSTLWRQAERAQAKRS